MLHSVKCYFRIDGDDHVIFVQLLVDVVVDADGFSYVVTLLHPWNKSCFIMMDDLSDVFLSLIC